MYCPKCQSKVELVQRKNSEGMWYNYWSCDDHGKVDPSNGYSLAIKMSGGPTEEDMQALRDAFKKNIDNSDKGFRSPIIVPEFEEQMQKQARDKLIHEVISSDLLDSQSDLLDAIKYAAGPGNGKPKNFFIECDLLFWRFGLEIHRYTKAIRDE